MNYKIVRYFLKKIMLLLAAIMLVPLAISVIYGEKIALAYIIPIAVLAVVGGIRIEKKPKKNEVHIREGFLICTLSWMLMSLFGALPFYISGAAPSFTDALFETVSGFTTTGSTILEDIESLPESLLFWRSFTHWIGGMGVLVFALAVFSQQGTKTMFIMRAEVPGPKVGRLVSKTKFTARILYGIYIGLTLIEFVMLLFGKMSVFDSITTAMSTAGTGGFSPKNASIAYYNSPYIEYVVTVFMFLFGINFTLFYFMLIRNFKDVKRNEELRWYTLIVLGATAVIVYNIYPLYKSFEPAFRAAVFQVSSIITTTGFITADFGKWPVLSQVILVLLMFFGACAGSTGGGLKMVRVILLFKTAKREVRHAINPRAVSSIKLDSHTVDENLITRTSTYFLVYIFVMIISIMLVSLDNLNITESVTSVITCMNNIGPGLGVVGPVGNFSSLSDFSKWVLVFDMLAGRLELFPVLTLFVPSFWK